MDELQKMIDVCENYKKGLYDITEFQHRLETVYLPDEYKHTLEEDQHNAFNYLEEVYYCYGVEEHKQYADQVADDLIKKAKLYLE